MEESQNAESLQKKNGPDEIEAKNILSADKLI
jgi:hypothetical protein